jgi:hypothetical protein
MRRAPGVREIGNRETEYCVRRQSEWKNARSQLLAEIEYKGDVVALMFCVCVCPLPRSQWKWNSNKNWKLARVGSRFCCDSEALMGLPKINEMGTPTARLAYLISSSSSGQFKKRGGVQWSGALSTER